MTPLQRALIEKAGHDHGFEHVLPDSSDAVHLGSARHPAKVSVSLVPQGFALTLLQGPPTLWPELARSVLDGSLAGGAWVVANEAALARCLRRAAVLAQALPHQVVVDFEAQVLQTLSAMPASDLQSTEVQRMVRQRVGQDRYRQAMLNYWGGACAVTGLTLQPVLRASHAKPWADCATDAERLDVFNGFLLSAHLDALFDQFLISFTEAGRIVISPRVSAQDRQALALSEHLALRWIADEHQRYLRFHRQRLDLG